jgi:hypothetical protein
MKDFLRFRSGVELLLPTDFLLVDVSTDCLLVEVLLRTTVDSEGDGAWTGVKTTALAAANML